MQHILYKYCCFTSKGAYMRTKIYLLKTSLELLKINFCVLPIKRNIMYADTMEYIHHNSHYQII